MMAQLSRHLESIDLSAQAIGELEFAPSRPFTNALLHNQEITALIRDTEPHERGLFSVDSSQNNGQTPSSQRYPANDSSRRKTGYIASQTNSSAVARVLGPDMLRKIRSSTRESSRGKGVDIDILLQGAEKLCAAYQVPGAMERVAALRKRHEQIAASIRRVEVQVKEQQLSMSRFNSGAEPDADEDWPHQTERITSTNSLRAFTENDLRIEEDAIRELEEKKKALEARVSGMEKDLGGLLR